MTTSPFRGTSLALALREHQRAHRLHAGTALAAARLQVLVAAGEAPGKKEGMMIEAGGDEKPR